MSSITRAILATSLLTSVCARAEDTGVFAKGLTGDSVYDKIWSAANLYKDEDNPILQKFALQGRLQLQTIAGDAAGESFNTQDYKQAYSSAKDHYPNDERVWGDSIEVRRAYFGFKSEWFRTWKLEGQINVDTDGHEGLGGKSTLYNDIYDLYAIYAPSETINIGFGKQEIKVTREQEISSKEIVTFERSLATNLVHPGNLTGVWAYGKTPDKRWLYEAGVYAGDQVREFSNLDAGAILLGKIGYDYSENVHYDSAVVSFRYMHNTSPGYQSDQSRTNSDKYLIWGSPVSPAFSDVLVLSNDISQGRFGLTTDLIYGFGYTGKASQNNVTKKLAQSDLWALNIIPSYYVAPSLQLVGRLQIANSADGNGLRVPGRYERLAYNNAKGVSSDDETGNTYLSAYAGINYYLYGNKLKLMSGVEYSEMHGGGNYDGYTALAGIRMSF